MTYLDAGRVEEWHIPGETVSKRVCYRLQTRTVEWLSTQHQTVLATFLGLRKSLYSCTEGMCHSSTRPGTSYHVTQWHTHTHSSKRGVVCRWCGVQSQRVQVICCLNTTKTKRWLNWWQTSSLISTWHTYTPHTAVQVQPWGANKTNTILLHVITDRRGCWKVANTCESVSKELAFVHS